MNKSNPKFKVGDFVYVNTINKYGKILEITKTPSGRTGYRLDIDYLIYFEEEFDPTDEHELYGKKFVEHVTSWSGRKISFFEVVYYPDGVTFDLVIDLVEDPSFIEDEYSETELIKVVAELTKENIDVVNKDYTPERIVWTLKRLDEEFNMNSLLDSFSAETEIVVLESLMNHYLDRLHKVKTKKEKEQFKKKLVHIVNQLKQLEYFRENQM